MNTDTGKRIIFVGSYLDLFNALQAAREQDAVIAAINERAADDRPAVDEAPWTDEPQDVAQMTAEHYGELPEPKGAVSTIFGRNRLTGPGAKRPRVVSAGGSTNK